jgi:branched-chain amino acid transport system substrate-binding protein
MGRRAIHLGKLPGKEGIHLKRPSIPLALLIIVSLMLGLAGCSPQAEAPKPIKIGLIIEQTGDLAAVGASSKNAAELAVKEINDAGGLEVSMKKHPIELIIEDNASKEEQTIAAAQKLITLDNVVAVIGPNASRFAIPASWIAENTKTAMISPWSTSPETTLDTKTNTPKKYVFRAAFTDGFQGRAIAAFAWNGLGAKTAAVLYDMDSAYNRVLAEEFKTYFTTATAEPVVFEGAGGAPIGNVRTVGGGQVVAFESYHTGDQNFTDQLTRIKAANPDVIFLPNYSHEVPLQVQQAHALGIAAPFLGGDGWGGAELLRQCGQDCEGYYFTAHFAADQPGSEAKKFIDAYTAKYGATPDDVSALTYDSFRLLFSALQGAAEVDREAVRDALARVSISGVTGPIKFSAGRGDPNKGAVVLQVKDGKFVWFANVQP